MARLGEALAGLEPSYKSNCAASAHISDMDPEDAQALVAALKVPESSPRLDCSAIARAVKATLGRDIPVDSLRRHRRTLLGDSGGCKCQV